MSRERWNTPIDDVISYASGLLELDRRKLVFARRLKENGKLNDDEPGKLSEEDFAALMKSASPVATAAQTISGLTIPVKVQREVNADFATIEAVRIPTPKLQDDKFREILRPIIQDYKTAKNHSPDLINYTWESIWEVMGADGHAYKVPFCDRSLGELEELRLNKRDVLLLPDEIYTPVGLYRLRKIFGLVYPGNWTNTEEMATVISHNSTKGGCIDVDMELTGYPYGIYNGNHTELEKRLAFVGKSGQRLPTFLMASWFSMLFYGYNFKNWSILSGSSYEDKPLFVCNNINGEVLIKKNDLGSKRNSYQSDVRTEGRVQNKIMGGTI